MLSAANRRQLSFGVRVLPGTCENITVSVFADNGCSQSSFSENFEYCLDAGLPRCTPVDIGGRVTNLTFSVLPNPTSGNVVLSFENLYADLQGFKNLEGRLFRIYLIFPPVFVLGWGRFSVVFEFFFFDCF
jgi:hypothetical protein